MLRFLKRIGRLFRHKHLPPKPDIQILTATGGGRAIPIEWGGEPIKPDFLFYIDFTDADRRLQRAAEMFAFVVIDALQNG